MTYCVIPSRVGALSNIEISAVNYIMNNLRELPKSSPQEMKSQKDCGDPIYEIDTQGKKYQFINKPMNYRMASNLQTLLDLLH